MSTPSASVSAASHGVVSASGWRLDGRRAMSLRPQVSSRLLIVQGRAWVTLGLAHRGAGNESGDVVLGAGESLAVPAGARVVMEPWEPQDEPVRFDWCAEPGVRTVHAGRFGREVLAPSRELAVALGQAGHAFLRLLRGLFGYSEFLVAGRGRVLTPFESNPP